LAQNRRVSRTPFDKLRTGWSSNVRSKGGKVISRESNAVTSSSKGYRRYWKRLDGLIRFTDGEHYLFQYEHTKIKRHVKVMGSKSPGACPEPDEWMATR